MHHVHHSPREIAEEVDMVLFDIDGGAAAQGLEGGHDYVCCPCLISAHVKWLERDNLGLIYGTEIKMMGGFVL